MPETMIDNYIQNTAARAVYGSDGPSPQFLMNTEAFKVLVVGLEAGQQIPLHPGEAAMYHFLEGEGLMIVDDETFAIRPGVTIITPAGAKRGMSARSRLVFLGSKGA